ncbi:MAG: hypothetical protein U0V73_06385 [Acidimicrobiia bacterium]
MATTTAPKKTTAPAVEATESIQDTIADFVKSVTGRFAEYVPDDLGQLLEKPAELVGKAFDLTTDIIESQRDFVMKLMRNAVPSKS